MLLDHPHQVSAAQRALMQYNPDTGEITFHHGGADPALVRQFIRQMARDLGALPGALPGLPVDQVAIDGMVMRTMFIPKGTLLVGKIHKLDCINVVASGDISILTEHGSGRMTAGHTAASPAGTQKIGFAHEDTAFINIFRTSETTIDGIENAIAWATFDEFDQHQLAMPTLEED